MKVQKKQMVEHEDEEEAMDIQAVYDDDTSSSSDDSEQEQKAKSRGRKALLKKFAKKENNSDDDSKAGSDVESDEDAMEGESSEEEEREEESKVIENDLSDSEKKPFRNKQRVLLISSRGIPKRYRHFMKDIEKLLPHSRKDAKYDTKNDLRQLNEIADMNNCNNTIYFESRKGEDLYLWMAKTPNGPSVKFQVQNVHNMYELNMAGNCLRGSRPFLSFDKSFDETKPELKLMKELFFHVFGTPKGHRKSKPFFDHVFLFSYLDKRIWFRNYQIVDDSGKRSLIEIGPRFVLNPIRVFSGSFGGPVLYENIDYVSPNEVRRMLARKKGTKYTARFDANKARELKLKEHVIPKTEMDEVDNVFKA